MYAKKKFEGTKSVTRSYISKQERQCQKKEDKGVDNCGQNTTQKAKTKTRTQLKLM